MRSWELKGYCAVVSIVMQSCHSNQGGHAFLPCEACVTKGKMPNVILQIVTLFFLTVKSMKVFTHSFIHSFIHSSLQYCFYLSLQQNSPRHENQEKLVENIDDEEKRLLKLMGWKDGGTESMVSYFQLYFRRSMAIQVFPGIR